MRVALVHDWLVAHRGGEKVLLELARMYPDAPIYTLVADRSRIHEELAARTLRTSFIQDLPYAPHRFRHYLPLFPLAVESLDLRGYDLVLSTSHCVAKGVRTWPGQVHVSYVHTPMRYLWDQMSQYLPSVVQRRSALALALALARLATTPLRLWDVRSSQRPTVLVANSRYVAARIERVWGRRAEVVYPPVEVDFFANGTARPRKGYLVVSALVPYKRVDIAVEMASRHSLPLTVIGDGPQRERLKAAAGNTVRFVHDVDDRGLRQAYAGARALLFPGVEDFGIVPVEAIAAGCPVIALQEGGATETVGPDSGVFFDEPTAQSLWRAVKAFEAREREGAYKPETLLARARRFTRAAFSRGMGAVIEQACNNRS